jgi:hypothetical protein
MIGIRLHLGKTSTDRLRRRIASDPRHPAKTSMMNGRRLRTITAGRPRRMMTTMTGRPRRRQGATERQPQSFFNRSVGT